MTTFDEVKEPLHDCLERVFDKKDVLKENFLDGLNVWNFVNLMKSYSFEENREFFGVSDEEGIKIKKYLIESSAGINGKLPFDYIPKMHEEFPNFLGRENPKYINFVNEIRKSLSIPEIKFY